MNASRWQHQKFSYTPKWPPPCGTINNDGLAFVLSTHNNGSEALTAVNTNHQQHRKAVF